MKSKIGYDFYTEFIAITRSSLAAEWVGINRAAKPNTENSISKCGSLAI